MLCAALAVLLSGCATAGPATDGCTAWRPIYISRADALTDGTAEQILVHNLTGARLCSWMQTR
ncbi:hypothetical protein FHW79_005233 [Azospirillum sp. OGB3]|nr:hypothetical protein [Azospirillum sp. OGB3]